MLGLKLNHVSERGPGYRHIIHMDGNDGMQRKKYEMLFLHLRLMHTLPTLSWFDGSLLTYTRQAYNTGTVTSISLP